MGEGWLGHLVSFISSARTYTSARRTSRVSGSLFTGVLLEGDVALGDKHLCARLTPHPSVVPGALAGLVFCTDTVLVLVADKLFLTTLAVFPWAKWVGAGIEALVVISIDNSGFKLQSRQVTTRAPGSSR